MNKVRTTTTTMACASSRQMPAKSFSCFEFAIALTRVLLSHIKMRKAKKLIHYYLEHSAVGFRISNWFVQPNRNGSIK
jgi:hypothetical protein